MITLDTVRADFLEPYGFPESSSPNLADFAREALVFDLLFPDRSEVYDLTRDDGEVHNLATRHTPPFGDGTPPAAALDMPESGLAESLESHLAEMPESARNVGELSLDPETIEMLKSLGYLEP